MLKPIIWYKRLLGYLIDSFFFALLAGFNNDPNYLLVYLVYIFLSESLFDGTYGKLIMGAIVVNKTDNRIPKLRQFVIRFFSRLIPFEIFSFISKYPEGLHDTLSKTRVVNRNEVKMNYDNLARYNEHSVIWWRRFISAFIDIFSFFSLSYPIVFFLDSYDNSLIEFYLLFFLPLTSLSMFIQESMFSRTLGKAVMGTYVANVHTNQKSSASKLFKRMLLRCLPFEFLSLIDYKPITPKDYYSETVVVHKNDFDFTEVAPYYEEKEILKNVVNAENPTIVIMILDYLKTIQNHFKKKLNRIYRLVLLLSIITPYLSLEYVFAQDYKPSNIGLFTLPTVVNLILVFIIYWILVLVGIWIYEGFLYGVNDRENEKSKN